MCPFTDSPHRGVVGSVRGDGMRSTGRRLVGGLAAFPSRLYGETASADGDLAETVVGGRCGAPPTQPHSQSLGKVTRARAHAPAPVVGTVTVCRGTVTVYGTRGGVGQVAGPVDGGRIVQRSEGRERYAVR